MTVEINSLDNGSGTNTKLDVYLCYNTQQKLFNPRPYCCIEEDQFCEMLTDKEIDKMMNGKIHFNVNKSQLFDRAKQVY